MASEIVKVVDPDEGAGYDYASLDAWEGGMQKHLPNADEISIAKCRSTGGTADTTGCVVTGWTTDATRYIKIWTDTGESYRHAGKWVAGNKYRLEVAGGICLEFNEDFCRVDGLMIFANAAGGHGIEMSSVGSDAQHYYSNNIIKGNRTNTQSDHAGIRINDSSGIECWAWNNIIYDFEDNGDARSGGIVLARSGGDIYLYNNTCTENRLGIEENAEGGVYCFNCLSYNNSSVDFSGAYEAVSDYNFSKDDTAPEAAGNSIHGDTDGKTADFVDAGNDDFHIDSTSDAIGEGTDDPQASGLYTDDIDQETRTSAWDIGADEYIVADGRTTKNTDAWYHGQRHGESFRIT